VNPDQQFGLIIGFGIFLPLTLAFGYPLLKAVIRRIERSGNPEPIGKGELEDLHARLGELDELRHRVAELEERVDFSERLLAQATPQERLKE